MIHKFHGTPLMPTCHTYDIILTMKRSTKATTETPEQTTLVHILYPLLLSNMLDHVN